LVPALEAEIYEPLSYFAFNFNLRPYDAGGDAAAASASSTAVTRCNFKHVLILVESSVWFERLKLKYDTLLSIFAFKTNSRHYTTASAAAAAPAHFDNSSASSNGSIIGQAVQVEPTKSKLKAPGTKRLKLEFENMLSGFAFN
jgi:hypothetical protein